jgi:hypothetical protein
MTHEHHDVGSQPTLWALDDAAAVKPQEPNQEPGDAKGAGFGGCKRLVRERGWILSASTRTPT